VSNRPGIALDVVDRHVHRGAAELRGGHLEVRGSVVVNGAATPATRAESSGRAQAALSAEVTRDLAERAGRRRELSRTAFFDVGLAHPGVELCIAGARLTVQQKLRGLRYVWHSETGQLRAERIGT
jgi:hypothetical protein